MTGETNKFDIAIIGAGPAGLSFALGLANTSLRIIVIERSSSNVLEMPPDDGREIALTHLSKKELINIGVWSEIEKKSISKIKEAKVFNGTSPYSLNFDHEETAESCLGYLVPNCKIRAAAYKKAREQKNIKILSDTLMESFSADIDSVHLQLNNKKTIEANLLISAEGRFTTTRRQMGISTEVKEFGKTCIVCKMHHQLFHNNVAYECFHYGRTLAVLPMSGNYSSIVITIPSKEADSILQMDETDFNQDIGSRFDHRLGKMRLVGERHAYPLVAIHASRFHSTRFALVGDASVGMHPVTAHGFNLGLSGAKILSDLIKDALVNQVDFASDSVLQKYTLKHQRKTRPLYHGTNFIVSLYNSETTPGKALRTAALRFGNQIKPFKDAIVKQLT